jgi:hypothetical protein
MCKAIVIAFAVLYLLALGLLVIGTFGLFGQEQDPLSGVFLIPLGFPWIRLVDLAPERAWPVLAALTPAINLAVLWGICRWRAPRN